MTNALKPLYSKQNPVWRQTANRAKYNRPVAHTRLDWTALLYEGVCGYEEERNLLYRRIADQELETKQAKDEQ